MCITETQHYSVCNTLGQISWELLNFLKKSSWTRLVAKTHMFDSKRLIVNWIYGLKSSGLRSKIIYPKYSKHWPYLLAYTLHCDCSEVLNHGLNHGLHISFTFQVFWVKIQDWKLDSYIVWYFRCCILTQHTTFRFYWK